MTTSDDQLSTPSGSSHASGSAHATGNLSAPSDSLGAIDGHRTNDPAETQLHRARALFDHGNYKGAREIAVQLVSHEAPEVQAAAQSLLTDLSPPGLTRYLLALTFALLTAVTIFAYTQ